MTIHCNQSCGTVVSLSVTAHGERGLLRDWGGGEHLPGGDLDRESWAEQNGRPGI